MSTILLSYDPASGVGSFTRTPGGLKESIWVRLRSAASDESTQARVTSHRIDLPWTSALSLLRTFAPLQEQLGFEFDVDDSSAEQVTRFQQDYAIVREMSRHVAPVTSGEVIQARLTDIGWNNEGHALKDYQLLNVQRLLSLPNGANFSVPGAGKTTVTFVVHLLGARDGEGLLVVAPRNAFPAWDEVIDDCLLPGPAASQERFVPLVGGELRIGELLDRRPTRMIISYDQLVRVDTLIEEYLSRVPVHLVLDESHRMKAGHSSLRGASLLRMGHLATRRDILSGTPMPQSSRDMESQLDFLWPGTGLGTRISRGEAPRQVLGDLYVRTTKRDLALPERLRLDVPVVLTDAHLAFYSVLKEDIHARASELRRGTSGAAIVRARRSVVRLLQAAVNPELVAETLQETLNPGRASALLEAVLREGHSARIIAAIDLVNELARQGRKVIVWTIFTSTLLKIAAALEPLRPAMIYGAVGLGSEADEETRQGQLRKFKEDPTCMVMVANPAAASEGISLHMHCHDAIYVDRSYNATHYLQSIDRIHRLGLPPDVVTRIHVLQNILPRDVGSIDRSVARRLAAKISGMRTLLDDPDLNRLELDEEEAFAPVDESIDARDIEDLLNEIEHPGDFDADDIA